MGKKIAAQRKPKQEKMNWKKKKSIQETTERHDEQQKKNDGQQSKSPKCGQDTTQ